MPTETMKFLRVISIHRLGGPLSLSSLKRDSVAVDFLNRVSREEGGRNWLLCDFFLAPLILLSRDSHVLSDAFVTIHLV